MTRVYDIVLKEVVHSHRLKADTPRGTERLGGPIEISGRINPRGVLDRRPFIGTYFGVQVIRRGVFGADSFEIQSSRIGIID